MPVGGQRLVSRAGHDEPFGGVGAGGTRVGTGSGSKGVLGNGLVVSTTEVVFGVSWQAVGSGSSRVSWTVAALAREAVRKSRKQRRSTVQDQVRGLRRRVF